MGSVPEQNLQSSNTCQCIRQHFGCSVCVNCDHVWFNVKHNGFGMSFAPAFIEGEISEGIFMMLEK